MTSPFAGPRCLHGPLPTISTFHLEAVQTHTFIYFGGWALVGVLLIYGLMTRDRLEMNVLRPQSAIRGA